MGQRFKILTGQRIVFVGKFGYSTLGTMERDRVAALAKARGATVADDVDARTSVVVMADTAANKGVQKSITSLNAKRASIRVESAEDFCKSVLPTGSELADLLRRRDAGVDAVLKAIAPIYRHAQTPPASIVVANEDLSGLDLSEIHVEDVDFDGCKFERCKLTAAYLPRAVNCCFDDADATGLRINEATDCSFRKADVSQASIQGGGRIDLTGGIADGITLGAHFGRRGSFVIAAGGASFKAAHLILAKLSGDFCDADLSGATLDGTEIADADFRGAKLVAASLIDCKLKNADFRGADLTDANLSGADLSGATIDGAVVSGAVLRDVKWPAGGVKKLKGYDPAAAAAAPVAGPNMAELDRVAGVAKRVTFTVQFEGAVDATDSMSVDTAGLRYGYGLRLPNLHAMNRNHGRNKNLSDALLDAARGMGKRKLRFETVDVSATKSPTKPADLKKIVIDALSEAFGQPVPGADELAKLTKEHREFVKEQGAADRERREKAKKAAEKQVVKQRKLVASKIESEVGKVTDVATFAKALALRADKSKLDKAAKMLKAEKFRLFSDVTDDSMAGVVKSQSDPDLVYACRIESTGHYACCTQNLNICGGLRGSPCKHLLVLILGLVNAGQLDPGTIDGWVAKSADAKPELDKEAMGEIFLKYKGAEAGEVDWRPTETLPEDYYAL